jgi:multimeric flavodoxin WrbA
MKIKIIGVCGSPIKGGNTEVYLKEALKAAEEVPDAEVETETILLCDWKDFKGCIHCNYCAVRQKPERFCSIDDEMTEVYPKMLEMDGLIIASPTYITRMSWLTAAFMDRVRAVGHGKLYRMGLKGKVGGALAVLFARHSGAETTLLSILQGYMLMDMIPVGLNMWGPYGAVGLSSYGGEGRVEPDDKLAVLKDKFGLRSARMLGKAVVEQAKLVKAGKEALGIKNVHLETYREALEKAGK